jgi:hypothetical protein
MATYSDLNGVTGNSFAVDDATLDASGLTAARTFTLPDASGTVALTSDLPDTPIDGGSASSVYLAAQSIDGGSASSTQTRTFDGGGA